MRYYIASFINGGVINEFEAVSPTPLNNPTAISNVLKSLINDLYSKNQGVYNDIAILKIEEVERVIH